MRSAIVKLAKGVGTLLLFATVGLALVIVAAPRFLDRIYYRGPVTDHFNGDRFFNPDGEDTARVPGGRGGRAGFLWRQLTGRDNRPAWPGRVAVQPAKPEQRVMGERMVATWAGHATVLVQTQGLNILTDPMWSEVAGPFNLLGPRRVAAPGIRFEDLPRIDLVLVSHNHYDHLDLPTLRRLWERDRPLILTSLGNDSIIAEAGMKVVRGDWGQRVPVKPGVDVIVTRNHHWGSRWFTDRNRALWSSFTVTLPGGNLYFAGDTGPGDMRWPDEAARHGPVRFAILPIGAFRFQPGEMGTGSHISPVGAVEVFQRLGASAGLGMHWGTFRLSFEGYDTPSKMLDALTRCTGTRRFVTTRIGGTLEVPAYAQPAPPQRALTECARTPEVLRLP